MAADAITYVPYKQIHVWISTTDTILMWHKMQIKIMLVYIKINTLRVNVIHNFYDRNVSSALVDTSAWWTCYQIVSNVLKSIVAVILAMTCHWQGC